MVGIPARARGFHRPILIAYETIVQPGRWVRVAAALRAKPLPGRLMATPHLNVDELAQRHAAWTVAWHQGPTSPEAAPPWVAIERNHRMNFDLWHEEDMARRDDLGAERVRQAKRLIDRCNQARNDAIEELDVWLQGQLPAASEDRPQHSETPGMIIDRLSILSLKLYHMRIEAGRDSAAEAHRRKCRERCGILETQLADLKACLASLLDELVRGARRFKLYRQLKMYNDAALNPQLYSAARPDAAGGA